MAAKENTTLSALCRNHILYGENAGLAIRDENIQQRIDSIEQMMDQMGSLIAEVNQRTVDNNVKIELLGELFKKSIAALAMRVEEAIKRNS